MVAIDELPKVQQLKHIVGRLSGVKQSPAQRQLGSVIAVMLQTGLTLSDCLALRVKHLDKLLNDRSALLVYDLSQVKSLVKEIEQNPITENGQVDTKIRKRQLKLNTGYLRNHGRQLLDGATGCGAGVAVCAWNKSGALQPKPPTASALNSLFESECARLIPEATAPGLTLHDVRTVKALGDYLDGGSLNYLRWYLGLRSDDDARAWLSKRLPGGVCYD